MSSSVIPEKDALLQSIENDPLFVSSTGNNSIKQVNDFDSQISSILNKESQLSHELHDFNSLKILKDLISEFNTNFNLFELENCYYSLQSLRKKIKEYSNNSISNSPLLSRQTLHFQRSLTKYVDNLHVKLIEKIYDLLADEFWNISSSNSIQFNKLVHFEENQIEINYLDFISMIKQLFLSDEDNHDNFLNLENNWFIQDIDINNNDRELVRNKLNNIFKDFVELNRIISILKSTLFNDKISFKFIRDSNKLEFVDSHANFPNKNNLLNNLANLIEFLKNSLVENDLVIVLDHLGNLLSTELIKFVKGNATKILDDTNLKNEVVVINDELIKLSKQNSAKCEWNYNGHEIVDLLNNEKLYLNLLIDNLFNDSILQIRKQIVNKNDWNCKRSANQKSHTGKSIHTANNNNYNDERGWGKVEKGESNNIEHPIKNNEDDDDDDENDAWGEEVDLDLDDLQSKRESIINKEDNNVEDEDNDAWGSEIDIDLADLQSKRDSIIDKTRHGDDNIGDEGDGDAWDEQWDLDDEEHKERQVEVQSPGCQPIEVTNLPELFINIVNTFKQRYNDIKKTNTVAIDQDYYKYKLNFLQTTFFAMIRLSYGIEWWQLFNDINEITNALPELNLLSELNIRNIETSILLKQKYVNKNIQLQLYELKVNEKNPSWSCILDKALPFIKQELLVPLAKIDTKQSHKFIINLLNFVYNRCITDIILRWDIISEKNSENLGELITLIVDNTKVDSLSNLPQYKELRERFQLIGRFLPLHLKEIMEMFYDGDFYLFSTQEIIQWIKLLFADTPLRQEAIDDIYEIREAANEN